VANGPGQAAATVTAPPPSRPPRARSPSSARSSGAPRRPSPPACRLGAGVGRTNALESLVIASFVRGLSVRDVEATLAEALGSEAALSKSTVSRICEAIKVEFESWRSRDLSGITLDYLYLDGSHFKFHPGAPSEPVLCAWGIDSEGAPVFIGLAPGSTESHDAWAGFLADLTGRGLAPPLLVISDGAPGLIGAAEQVLAKSLRQRCLIHRARNVLAKVPKAAQAEVKAEFWKIFDDIEAEPGQAAVDVARGRIAAFEKHYGTTYPAAVKCLTADVASLTVCFAALENGRSSIERSTSACPVRRTLSGEGNGPSWAVRRHGRTATPRSRAAEARAASNVASEAWWRTATSNTQQSGSLRPVLARSSARRNGSSASCGATSTPAARRSSCIAAPRPTRTPPTRTSAIVTVWTSVEPGVASSRMAVAAAWWESTGLR